MPVSNDLANLSHVVKNDVVKKTVYDKLVTKGYNIDTTKFVLKTTYDTDKSDLEKKIPITDNFVKTSDMIKIANIAGKIGGAATKSDLTAVS